jgi:hypothetical protein
VNQVDSAGSVASTMANFDISGSEAFDRKSKDNGFYYILDFYFQSNTTR